MSKNLTDLRRIIEEIDKNIKMEDSMFISSYYQDILKIEDVYIDDAEYDGDMLIVKLGVKGVYTSDISFFDAYLFKNLKETRAGIDIDAANEYDLQEFYQELEYAIDEEGYHDEVGVNLSFTLRYYLYQTRNYIEATLEDPEEDVFDGIDADYEKSDTKKLYQLFARIAENHSIPIEDYETFNEDLQSQRDEGPYYTLQTELHGVDWINSLFYTFRPYKATVEFA